MICEALLMMASYHVPEDHLNQFNPGLGVTIGTQLQPNAQAIASGIVFRDSFEGVGAFAGGGIRAHTSMEEQWRCGADFQIGYYTCTEGQLAAAIPTVFIEMDGIALHLARITGAYAVALRYTF
jgi:hypothetical protein